MCSIIVAVGLLRLFSLKNIPEDLHSNINAFKYMKLVNLVLVMFTSF